MYGPIALPDRALGAEQRRGSDLVCASAVLSVIPDPVVLLFE